MKYNYCACAVLTVTTVLYQTEINKITFLSSRAHIFQLINFFSVLLLLSCTWQLADVSNHANGKQGIA